MLKKNTTVLNSFALLIFLFSCQLFAKDEQSASIGKVESPPIAIVNGQKINRAEFEAIISEVMKGQDSDSQKQIKKKALDNLISQALVLQSIEADKSQQSVENQLRLNYLKKNAEFDFFITKVASKRPKFPKEEIDKYVVQNPKFFADRKTYHFYHYAIDYKDKRVLDFVSSAVKKGETLGGLSGLLDSQNINYLRTNNWYGTEQVSPNILETLEQMQVNNVEIVLSPDKKVIYVIYLLGVYSDPLSSEDANKAVLTSLSKTYAVKAVEKYLEGLRSKAKIEISDEFLSEISEGDLNGKEAVLNAFISSVGIFQWMLAAWNFALLVLVPACVTSLFKQIVAKKSEQKLSLGEELVAAPHPLLAITDWRIPILVTLPIALFTPLFLFLSDLPMWMTGLRFMSSLIMGISFGAGLVVMIWKLKPLNYLFQNKWVAVLGLLAIDLSQFLAK